MRKTLLNDGAIFGPVVVTEANQRLFGFLERSEPSEYDRIMDSLYNETGIGGGMHRSFDGSHTLHGSWDRIRDETGSVDLWEYLKAHGNELVTPEGVPLTTLDKQWYDSFSSEVSEQLGDVVTPGQLGSVIRDANSLNAGELLCGGIGSLFMFAAIRSDDHRAISRVVGANLCIGLGTGNLLQVAVALGGLAYGIQQHKIRSWEILKGSAPAMAGLLGYGLAEHVAEATTGGSVLVGLTAGVAASALLAHLDRQRQQEVTAEVGEDPRYVAVLTRGLLQKELRLLQHRRLTLSLDV